MTTLTNQELLAEFYYTQKAIKLATGLTPRYWRPVSLFIFCLFCISIPLENDVLL
jgi:hypothetical protein